ncbi:unnamed protein product [Linum trigynum]|uniref:Myb/SANT-like domain-containing protein n=1 Tax=Linum trigynum TaxID=586398 RepID=A0AAV2CGG7_9ROSI
MEVQPINHTKQERARTRWTPALDKVFADLVVKQIQLGNRRNNVFDKKTWNTIRNEFNKQTDLNFNNNQLRKHFDVLRTRFFSLTKSSSSAQTDFAAIDESCCIAFDLWEDCSTPVRQETGKVKDCPIYGQLCTIFSDTSVDGKYAQSSHFEGLDNGATHAVPCPEASHPENEEDPPTPIPVLQPSEKTVKSVGERKRKQPSETHLELEQDGGGDEQRESVAAALHEMIAAFKERETAAKTQRRDERYSITSCIRALDEIKGVDQRLYFSALDLFDDPSLRETFMSLKGDAFRLAWLQGKCGGFNFSTLFGF